MNEPIEGIESLIFFVNSSEKGLFFVCDFIVEEKKIKKNINEI